jgi:hypothetical protein
VARSFGDTVANEILALYVKGSLPAAPAGCYLHYYLDEPEDNGTGGTPLPADGWYAPLEVRSVMGSPSARVIANTTAIEVGTPLVARGPIRFAALRAGSASTSLLIIKNQLATFVTTIVGTPWEVGIGQLTFEVP